MMVKDLDGTPANLLMTKSPLDTRATYNRQRMREYCQTTKGEKTRRRYRCSQEWYEYRHRYSFQEKFDVVLHYSNGTMKCVSCGENDIDVLCVDHIHNDGSGIDSKIAHGNKFYRWLRENNYPYGLQVLCWNCNWIKTTTNNSVDHLSIKRDVMSHYSKRNIECSLCFEKDLRKLAVDHIFGGGVKHLKEIGGNFYYWLKRNHYPKGFRVLCHNCNHKEYLKRIREQYNANYSSRRSTKTWMTTHPRHVNWQANLVPRVRILTANVAHTYQ